jgi:hypothetical protein
VKVPCLIARVNHLFRVQRLIVCAFVTAADHREVSGSDDLASDEEEAVSGLTQLALLSPSQPLFKYLPATAANASRPSATTMVVVIER